MQSFRRVTTILKRLLASTTIILVGIWVITGGVAIQRVQRFDSTRVWRLNDQERFNISLLGTSSDFSIPFLIIKHSEQSPFSLAFSYYSSGERAWQSIKINSITIQRNHSPQVELLPNLKPLILPIETKRYSNSSSKGIVWNTMYMVEYTVPCQCEIIFQSGDIVHCHMDIEMIGEDELTGITLSKKLEIHLDLVGSTIDYTKTYWSYLSNQ